MEIIISNFPQLQRLEASRITPLMDRDTKTIISKKNKPGKRNVKFDHGTKSSKKHRGTFNDSLELNDEFEAKENEYEVEPAALNEQVAQERTPLQSKGSSPSNQS